MYAGISAPQKLASRLSVSSDGQEINGASLSVTVTRKDCVTVFTPSVAV